MASTVRHSLGLVTEVSRGDQYEEIRGDLLYTKVHFRTPSLLPIGSLDRLEVLRLP